MVVGEVAYDSVVELRTNRKAVTGSLWERAHRAYGKQIWCEPNLGHRGMYLYANGFVKRPMVAVVRGSNFDDEIGLYIDRYGSIDRDGTDPGEDRNTIPLTDELNALLGSLEDRGECESNVANLDKVVIREEGRAIIPDKCKAFVGQVASTPAAQHVDVATGVTGPEDTSDGHEALGRPLRQRADVPPASRWGTNLALLLDGRKPLESISGAASSWGDGTLSH